MQTCPRVPLPSQDLRNSIKELEQIGQQAGNQADPVLHKLLQELMTSYLCLPHDHPDERPILATLNTCLSSWLSRSFSLSSIGSSVSPHQNAHTYETHPALKVPSGSQDIESTIKDLEQIGRHSSSQANEVLMKLSQELMTSYLCLPENHPKESPFLSTLHTCLSTWLSRTFSIPMEAPEKDHGSPTKNDKTVEK